MRSASLPEGGRRPPSSDWGSGAANVGKAWVRINSNHLQFLVQPRGRSVYRYRATVRFSMGVPHYRELLDGNTALPRVLWGCRGLGVPWVRLQSEPPGSFCSLAVHIFAWRPLPRTFYQRGVCSPATALPTLAAHRATAGLR